MDAITHNVWVQGAFVSLVVAVLRKAAPKFDAKAKDPNQVHVIQIVLAALSAATQLLTAYVSGHLAQVDFAAMIQVLLIALGVHKATKDLKASPYFGEAGKWPLEDKVKSLVKK